MIWKSNLQKSEYLKWLSAYAILCLGKNEMSIHVGTKRKPQRRHPLGFSIGLVVAISIKPFADIVASYTCSDGDKK